MSRTSAYGLSLTGSSKDARARLRELVTEQVLQSTEMRPARDQPNSVASNPSVVGRCSSRSHAGLRGENINLSLSSTAQGTKVAVSGKVAGHGEKVSNRKFWARTLTAT